MGTQTKQRSTVQNRKTMTHHYIAKDSRGTGTKRKKGDYTLQTPLLWFLVVHVYVIKDILFRFDR